MSTGESLWLQHYCIITICAIRHVCVLQTAARLKQTEISYRYLTSVPYLESAALASCLIFSRYICAARLLYFALVSLVVQPCWRKKAIFSRTVLWGKSNKEHHLIWQSCISCMMVCENSWRMNKGTYRIRISSNLHTSQLKPAPVGVQLCRSGNNTTSHESIKAGGLWACKNGGQGFKKCL